MILEPLVAADVAVCINYICDEVELLGGNTRLTAVKMENAIEGKDGWKVTDGDMIVGFAVVEEFGTSVLITSLVVARDKRIGEATWLLFDAVLKFTGDRSLVYIPIHKNMWASKLCVNGVVDKRRAQEWVTKLEGRYGRK